MSDTLPKLEIAPFAERLLNVMNILGVTKTSFAYRTDNTPQGLNKLIGAEEQQPGLEKLQKIFQAFPEISPDYLIMERGAAIRPVNIQQSGNTGQTIGQVTGGAVHYTVEDCRHELDQCKQDRAKLTKDLADARGRLLELLDKK